MPNLPKKPWIIGIDLDGLLCRGTSSDKYAGAIPIQENINKVNTLVKNGHRVIIHTARGWYLYDITYDWLKKHGVLFERLVMGKLYAHMYIDDLSGTLDDMIRKGPVGND